jgi:hypothetical protein
MQIWRQKKGTAVSDTAIKRSRCARPTVSADVDGDL